VPIDRDATLKRAEKLLRQGKLEAAIAEYAALTSAQPSDWSSLNVLGDLYVRAGQVDRAVIQFGRAGEQLAREGELSKAAAIYRKALRLSPADPRARRGLDALAERQEGPRPGRAAPIAANDADARVAAAREAQDAAQNGRACALLIEAADLYEAQGRTSDALAAVAEAASVDPSNPEYRLRMLQMLIAQGELAQARSAARTSIELVIAADALDRAGRVADSAETLEEAALADRDNVALRQRALRQLVTAGELDRARHLARTPDDLLVITAALHGEDRAADAVGVLERAAQAEPDNDTLRAPLVAACLAAGDLERAREAARTSSDWLLLSDAMRQQGRTGEAIAAMHEATQRDPHDAALHAAFVRACLDAGDLARAREQARTTEEIVAVAEALERAGDRDAAVQMRAAALRRDPDDPELRRHLVFDYLDAGARDRAHALLTRDVAGDDATLLLELARLEFGIGRRDEGRRALAALLVQHPAYAAEVTRLGAGFGDAGDDESAFACVEALADWRANEGDQEQALDLLRSFADRAPHHVPALLKLIEGCVDRGLEPLMKATQERLADAYLRTGQAAEARLIAEDLVLRAPWERAAVERLLRALVLCRDEEPEQTIATMLCGDAAFPPEGP
jgi:tetratricopeptide (TPR) repeat protein